MSPVSATYCGISGYVIFWVLFAVVFAIFVKRAYFLVRIMLIGKKEDRFDKIGQRIKSMIIEVGTQTCGLKNVANGDYAGIGHALIFWGFCWCLGSYIIFIGFAGGFGLYPYILDTAFDTVYKSILDIMVAFVLIAIIWAAIRRFIIRPERLKNEQSLEAGFIMFLVFGLMVLHFCIEGFGLAGSGYNHGLPPISAAFARFLSGTDMSQSTLTSVSTGAWWLHYFFILGFMLYIPYSKHLHVLASAFNVTFKSLKDKVVLEPIPLEALEGEGAGELGVSKIQDYTWKDLLDLYACAKCGRCQVNCPAHTSGKTLSPKEVIHNLKDHLMDVGPGLLKRSAGATAEVSTETPAKAMIGDVVTEDEIWACTTCGACQEVCPVDIEHIRKLIKMRQNLVLVQNKMPESAQVMLRNLQARGNPWAGAQSLRLRGDWTNDMGLKILGQGENTSANTLFWVGCTGALIDRNVLATLALTRVLKAAGIDFAVLGDAEPCCGDPARRTGYEFQFQISAEENIETFKRYNIKEIITSCPHCYNTLKNEYPKYGADFKVIHYTELVADLIKQGKLKLSNEVNSVITYHDPCYLSRYNGVYKEPRRILQSIPKTKVKEMERSKRKTFCCGGGGGHMWVEEQHGTEKISHVRIEEVLKTKAETVVTSCPYCLQMLEEGIEYKGMKDSFKAKDLIEVVEASMKQS
jgi:Fe-S oxidoreductase